LTTFFFVFDIFSTCTVRPPTPGSSGGREAARELVPRDVVEPHEDVAAEEHRTARRIRRGAVADLGERDGRAIEDAAHARRDRRAVQHAARTAGVGPRHHALEVVAEPIVERVHLSRPALERRW
jgi:hypothetical protein